ncbi:hypothetical protein [Spirosoma sp. 209]|uniref:hypothetical protein n=1 Tax=Spirosoma sp. 209 TaxID=1955701 RepID=UPI00098D4B7E|nr:hypothetical protein [Spirosoma sp. 209]
MLTLLFLLLLNADPPSANTDANGALFTVAITAAVTGLVGIALSRLRWGRSKEEDEQYKSMMLFQRDTERRLALLEAEQRNQVSVLNDLKSDMGDIKETVSDIRQALAKLTGWVESMQKRSTRGG